MSLPHIFRNALLATALLAAGRHSEAQTTANWINAAADLDWNNAGNWDVGVPA